MTDNQPEPVEACGVSGAVGAGGVPSARVGDEAVCRRCGHPNGQHYTDEPRACKKRCRCVSFAGPVEPVADTEAAETTERELRADLAHLLAVENYGSLGLGVMARIADGGSLDDVLEFVGDHMNARDHVDDESIALFERAKAAARPPVALPTARDCETRTVEYSIVRDVDGHRYGGYNEDCRAPGCDCYLARLPEPIIGDEHVEQREVYRTPWRRVEASS